MLVNIDNIRQYFLLFASYISPETEWAYIVYLHVYIYKLLIIARICEQ